FALGAAGRVALQAAAGAIDGAAGSAFSTAMTNLDYGRAAETGVGWAAVVGGVTGGIGGYAGAKLAGSSRLSRSPGLWEWLGRMEQGASYAAAGSRIADAGGIIGKAVLKAPGVLAGAAKGGIHFFGPQWSW
ncbi:MAG TPA: hypothetical protein VGV85_01970, partial [Longimicrobiaceae bacterium]|nr:hypothetical protein [Longimicrobiaceae bacterium]